MADAGLTRRAMLRAIPVTVAPLMALPSAGAAEPPPVDPMRRLELARDELLAAAKAAYPKINDWRLLENDRDKPPYLFMAGLNT